MRVEFCLSCEAEGRVVKAIYFTPVPLCKKCFKMAREEHLIDYRGVLNIQ